MSLAIHITIPKVIMAAVVLSLKRVASCSFLIICTLMDNADGSSMSMSVSIGMLKPWLCVIKANSMIKAIVSTVGAL